MNIRSLVDATRVFLRDRKRAYQLLFNPRNPAGMVVLQDLMQFCRAAESVYHPDSRKTDIAIGRHEVWLRIQQHLNLTETQLFALYNGNQVADVMLARKQENDDA